MLAEVHWKLAKIKVEIILSKGQIHIEHFLRSWLPPVISILSCVCEQAWKKKKNNRRSTKWRLFRPSLKGGFLRCKNYLLEKHLSLWLVFLSTNIFAFRSLKCNLKHNYFCTNFISHFSWSKSATQFSVCHRKKQANLKFNVKKKTHILLTALTSSRVSFFSNALLSNCFG